jgi:hypothetical protein
MPELASQCTPAPETPSAAIPPIIDPEDFERFEGFRETTCRRPRFFVAVA